MEIRLYQQETDNNIETCRKCIWYEPSDFSVGQFQEGCTHPILYRKDGSVIKEIDDMIVKCMENPNHCILYDEDK